MKVKPAKLSVIVQAFEEGKRVAYKRKNDVSMNPWFDLKAPVFNLTKMEYALIEEPPNMWEFFDWEFFKPYGGVGVNIPGSAIGSDQINIETTVLDASYPQRHRAELRESPFYYWPGGDCPVPHNVEVIVVCRDGDELADIADEFSWDHAGGDGDIIAFQITGDVI